MVTELRWRDAPRPASSVRVTCLRDDRSHRVHPNRVRRVLLGGDELRPVVWGLILSVLGGFFWILFSVVFGIAYGLTGTNMGAGYWGLIYLTGLTMIFGLPAGIVGEIIRWRRGRQSRAVKEVNSASSSIYCHQCGKLTQGNLSFCGYCGSKM